MASVLSVSSRALLDACARLGLDTGAILRAARIDAATLQDPDARIPIEQAAALWQKAYDVSGDPNLALHAVEALSFGAYRVIDFLGSTAPTIGDAIARLSNYYPLINDVVRLRYTVGDRVVPVWLEAPSRPQTITRPYAEYTLAAVFLRMRAATNQRYLLARVEFSHPKPADISEHERVFECPVLFGADACRLVYAREVWDMPRANSDPILFSLLETHAKMLIEHLPDADDVVGRVREAIRAELRGGTPKLEAVAKSLAMSPRTLQRRLREQGAVFNDVLDVLRFEAARTYLSQKDVAATEVAYLLGFADASAFHHAFKRWSGLTPIEYRRRAAAV
jgi:AraC-like DNA-binding protein